MAKWMTLVPAYGRDYKDATGVLAHWLTDKDFTIADVSSQWNGAKINMQDANNNEKETIFKIRYNKLRDFVLIGPKNDTWGIINKSDEDDIEEI